ncbi:MAG: hypothetical protein ABI807_05070, partial [Sporichthyaceae bacterium]
MDDLDHGRPSQPSPEPLLHHKWVKLDRADGASPCTDGQCRASGTDALERAGLRVENVEGLGHRYPDDFADRLRAELA